MNESTVKGLAAILGTEPTVLGPMIAGHVIKDATHYMRSGNETMAKILLTLGATRAWLDHTKDQREQISATCRQMVLDGKCKSRADEHYQREMEAINAASDAFVARSWAEFSAKEAA